MELEARFSTAGRAGGRRMPLAAIAYAACVVLLFATIFALHSRWIFTHFSSDGYLEDSGWLAYLFESADPLLHNPSGVNDLSFYAHHISPHIFLFGAPLATLPRFTGFQIFAYHQGLFFGLFFLSLCLIVARPGMRRRDAVVASASALVLGALSNALFQAASYPHYEIAMIAIASLAIAAWLARYRFLFLLCLAWLPLVREDGGFYAATVCIACIAVEQDRGRRMDSPTRLLILLAVAGLAASAASFLLKAWLFPGFSAFANNFSGDGWSHVTSAFVAERVQAMLRNLNIVPVLLGCALLAAFDIRYVTGLALLSPIFLLHLLAIRPEHGYFTLYFALPWLLPCAIWLAVFVRRSRMAQAAAAEGLIILAAALALSAPIQAAAGARGSFWFVASWAFQRPVEDTRDMQEFVRWARKSLAGTADGRWPSGRKGCVSFGIAALVPNDIRPDEMLTIREDLRTCDVVFLMRGDVQYGALGPRAKAAGFELRSSKRNAEMWLPR